MEVTKDNYLEVVPEIEAALAECVFWSFDTEFTGLSTNDKRECFYDTLQERYHKSTHAAKSFVIMQFGVSFFKWVDCKWEAKTFSFYVFPSTFKGQDKRFLCQTSSIEFLSNNNFDFNKFIYQGVPFMPLVTFEKLKNEIAAKQERQDTPARPPIVPTSERDIEFAADIRAKVEAWLESESLDPLELKPVNSYLRALTYQIVDELKASPICRCGVRSENDNGVTLFKVGSSQTEADAAAAAASMRELTQACGFSLILASLAQSGKPAIGHHCLLDVLYSMEQFHAPLPETWSEFTGTCGDFFKGGVFDTKHIVQPLYEVFEGRNALGDVYQTLIVSPKENKCLMNFTFPEIAHAPGFNRYDQAEQAHDAGFDAFMTGAVFARLLSLPPPPFPSGASTSVDGEPVAPSAALLPLTQLDVFRQSFHNRLAVFGSDYPFAALRGEQPLPNRERVLFLDNVPFPSSPSIIRKRFQDVGHEVQRVVPKGPKSALVVLQDESLALEALQAISDAIQESNDWNRVTVGTYATSYKSYLDAATKQDPRARRPGELVKMQVDEQPLKRLSNLLGTDPSGGGRSLGGGRLPTTKCILDSHRGYSKRGCLLTPPVTRPIYVKSNWCRVNQFVRIIKKFV